jgi:deoxyadenosine/deoxycytidine kinase
MGLMSERDYENYKALFHEMSDYLRPPDLLIYLRAKVPTLVHQIQQRGRDYESTIRIDYLERLNQLYETWIDRYPHQKLIIETDNLDFVNNREDLGKVISLIEQRMFGLFSDT